MKYQTSAAKLWPVVIVVAAVLLSIFYFSNSKLLLPVRVSRLVEREATVTPLDTALNSVPKQRYFLVVMTLLKNEAAYLAEWLEFHRIQGVDRFILYDHNSTDYSYEIARPYIKQGLVEWVKWPDDHGDVERKSGLKRDWIGQQTQSTYYNLLNNECIKIPDSKTTHKHDGCQKSAFLDGVARYRWNTDWIATFDVDEFMFVGAKSPFEADSTPLVKALTALGHFSQVTISGRVFGTQGFLDDPPGLSHGLPFSLVTEFYRYRGKLPDQAMKSFVRPAFVTDCSIHWFTILDGAGLSLTLRTTENIRLNHYQYKSILGAHRKAVNNGNKFVEYNSEYDRQQSEVMESDVTRYIPQVRRSLQLKLVAGVWNTILKPKVPASLQARSPINATATVCVIATNFAAEFHHLRRSTSTLKIHLDNNEQGILYQFHTYILKRGYGLYPNLTKESVAIHLPDIVQLSTTLTILEKLPADEILVEQLSSKCSGLDYVLILGDKMETAAVDFSAISSAINLLQRLSNYFRVTLSEWISGEQSAEGWSEVLGWQQTSKLQFYSGETDRYLNGSVTMESLAGQLFSLPKLSDCLQHKDQKACYNVLTPCFLKSVEACSTKQRHTLLFNN